VSGAPAFQLDHDVSYGDCVQVTPLIRRVTAENPGKFTFKGTGTYIVGHRDVAVIDPGPDDPSHVDALMNALRRETVTHIVVTHTHRDHSPACGALSEATGAATYAFGPHPHVAAVQPDGQEPGEEGGDTDFEPDIRLGHRDLVSGDGWSLEAVHTPGHISNHLCFGLAEENALFTGDHVMGWSTTIIPPPDGDLAAYLSSLDLVIERDDAVLWPTHGPPIHAPGPYLEALREHRLQRNEQVLRCLGGGLTTVGAMVAVMYADKDEELHKPAARTVLAHLIYLIDQGQVRCAGEPTAAAEFFRV
jgi:glyoxylase-like metal-dependent hydrolase (beta-lactamase superfamily II)